MKRSKQYKLIMLPALCLLMIQAGRVAAQDEPVTSKELVKLHYFNDNNRLQYLEVESLLKTGRKLDPLANKTYELYLDKNAPGNFIGTVTTGKNGLAKSILPPALKSAWRRNPNIIL